jgi:hypothetical protein
MAITFNTDRLQGLSGVTINGVYCRIQSVTVKKYDAETDPDVAVQWRCLYDVILHASATKRNADNAGWGDRLRSAEIDHFTCTYDPTSNANPYAQAYVNLKSVLAAGGSPIASSISDA